MAEYYCKKCKRKLDNLYEHICYGYPKDDVLDSLSIKRTMDHFKLRVVVSILMNMEINPFHKLFNWSVEYDECRSTNCPDKEDIKIRNAEIKKGNYKFQLPIHNKICPVTLLRDALTKLGYKPKSPDDEEDGMIKVSKEITEDIEYSKKLKKEFWRPYFKQHSENEFRKIDAKIMEEKEDGSRN